MTDYRAGFDDVDELLRLKVQEIALEALKNLDATKHPVLNKNNTEDN